MSFVLESEAQLASSVPTATDKMADTTDAAGELATINACYCHIVHVHSVIMFTL